jgi:formylmethanofuran dehydrogenase subunit D
MRCLMNTGRTIRQGDAVEYKLARKYQDATSICYLHPLDMMDLGILEGEHVLLRSGEGEVALKAVEREDLRRGTVYVPYGPYANHITPPGTHNTGMPDFKSILVEITPTEERIKTLMELMEALGGVRYDH